MVIGTTILAPVSECFPQTPQQQKLKHITIGSAVDQTSRQI